MEGYVKPRYDGKGSEFGLIHRDLGPGYNMFDLDGIWAVIETNLKLKRQDKGFVEWRIKKEKVEFIAVFEIKAQKTENSIKALDKNEGNSKARLEMAKRLGARLFVGFANNDKPPFDFYEINTKTGESEYVGKLEYSKSDRLQKVRSFWHNILKIYR